LRVFDSTAGQKLPFSTSRGLSVPKAATRSEIFIAAAFMAVWIWSAINPVKFSDWCMENVLVVFVAGLMFVLRHYFRISTFSLALIAIFLSLHEVGAHYVYDNVPFGFWLKDTFHLHRNDYDRIVHFAFGVCWSYVIREMYIQLPHPRGFLTYYVPVIHVLALSAIYEIIEAYTAQADPKMAASFVGMQGDLFDSQRDMLCAGVGAVLLMIATACYSAMRHRNRRLVRA